MSLLPRNERVALGTVSSEAQSGVVSLRKLRESNPLSNDFKANVGNTPKELYKYLLYCQRLAYGKTVVEAFCHIPRIVFLRNFKLLLKIYTPDQLKRATMYASLKCRQPYTTKIIGYFAGKYFNDPTYRSAPAEKQG